MASTKPTYIYFEPQTGVVRPTPIRSNFYIYRLAPHYLAKVELAAEKAQVTSSGLVYDKKFLEWLNRVDTKWDQRSLPVGRAVTRGEVGLPGLARNKEQAGCCPARLPLVRRHSCGDV